MRTNDFWIRPDWPAPAAVGALMSTRGGGVSCGPFASLNLREGIGDDAQCVSVNQARHAQRCEAIPVWLSQVHGARVVHLVGPTAAGAFEADAAVTTVPGLACSVQVADCLPVLLSTRQGLAVAAVHAGWRGLAGGVLEAALSALCVAGRCAPSDVLAWLGPAIGPRAFEVGFDVLEAFGATANAAPGFTPVLVPATPAVPKWLADLAWLARHRLGAAGVDAVYGNDGSQGWCTWSNPSKFFSYRRDAPSGRLAASIWLRF